MRFQLFPDRERLMWDYFDVTGDPLAPSRCEVPREVREALVTAGCEKLGYALAVLRANGAELVTEIWRSDDGATIVEVTNGGRVELITIYEDGTLLKTFERPASTWNTIRFASGTRVHKKDRVHYELVSGPTERVLSRHRERRLVMKGTAVPAETISAHFAARIRTAELRDARIHKQLGWQFGLSLGSGMLVGLAVMFAKMPRHHTHPERVPLVMLASFLACMAVAIPADFLSKWFLAPWIVRLRPGPPPRPASDLFALAEGVKKGRVARY